MNKVLYILFSILLLLIAPMLNASPDEHQSEGGHVFCPVSPEETVDSDIFTEYKGSVVLFCCNRCRKKFLADPAAYLHALPQFSTEAEPGSEHADSAHAHSGQGVNAAKDRAHDHARDHGPEAERAMPLKFLGKFHPLVVHFPIALILVALLSEGLGIWKKSDFFAQAARFTLSLGAASAVAAAALGWLAAMGARYSGDLIQALFFHRWLGVSVAILSVVTAALAHVHSGTVRLVATYRAALVLSAALVGIVGHFGATLIYGTDYFSW